MYAYARVCMRMYAYARVCMRMYAFDTEMKEWKSSGEIPSWGSAPRFQADTKGEEVTTAPPDDEEAGESSTDSDASDSEEKFRLPKPPLRSSMPPPNSIVTGISIALPRHVFNKKPNTCAAVPPPI